MLLPPTFELSINHLNNQIMETLNLILDLAYEIGMGVVSSFFLYGFLSAVFGLFIGIWAVRKINKNKGFQRAFGLWTFVAKLNMVYLPVVAMISMGILGGIYGLNGSINSYLETAVHFSIDELGPYVTSDIMSTTVAKYGTSYLVTDIIDTMFWVAYRGAFIFLFITMMQWPIFEFLAHKLISVFIPVKTSQLSY